MKHLAEKEPPLLKKKNPFLNSTGWCCLGTVPVLAKKPRKTPYSAFTCFYITQSRCFPSSFSEGTLHPPAHCRAPSFSNCSVEGWADLLHPVTPLKLLLADSHHQRGEMLSQSCTQPDHKHSQGEAAQPRWKREVTAPGMLSAAHGASAADTVVSKASFCLGFVQGFYFAELLCFSFLSCNLSL